MYWSCRHKPHSCADVAETTAPATHFVIAVSMLCFIWLLVLQIEKTQNLITLKVVLQFEVSSRTLVADRSDATVSESNGRVKPCYISIYIKWRLILVQSAVEKSLWTLGQNIHSSSDLLAILLLQNEMAGVSIVDLTSLAGVYLAVIVSTLQAGWDGRGWKSHVVFR